MNTINSLVSALLQVALFSIIPVMWWLMTARKQVTFFQWIGLKKILVNNKKRFVFLFVLTSVLLSAMSYLIIPLFADNSVMATSQFAGKGISVIISALIYAFVQTGLSEEIFFRGFLGKRLIGKFTFMIGNTIQAILFGLLHGILLFGAIGVAGAIAVTVLTGVIGWVMGYINEKQSGGSIVSSWILHGIANTLSSFVAMFSLI
ncbi:CAAX protease [Paenibacillus selenitireducens]|uniref:CAAX protease n=1 Tax=Paenibacillus selenitireducens TaxID=1324314 RepID=A0A1T2XM84_9BACL|nr:type II CAAX endopeptidase family protein [Paenibacillus selenitireducens]OPA80856.1 CAAX protease [Paenibacillus selenitireducens]